MRRKKRKVKPRGPMRDNSRNISVRMTEEQYQRLQKYLGLTHMRSTVYFRHLIHEDDLKGRSNELNHAMHASLNKVYSNVQQIVRINGPANWTPTPLRKSDFWRINSVRRSIFLQIKNNPRRYALSMHKKHKKAENISNTQRRKEAW